ncbi:MAG: glycine zipper family protein [Rhodopila sp.]
MRHTSVLIALAPSLAVGACTVPPPSGPSVMALPPQGKSLDQFQREDMNCRVYADQALGGINPRQAASNAGDGSAVAGTALGGGLGAAAGAVGGAAGAGAAVGAAAGLLTGTVIGANNAQLNWANAQARYDTAYTQCMYASGNSVQSAPSSFALAYPYGYPRYSYGPAVVAGPTILFGGGWGWGGGWRWHGGGWHRHGWHGGGWHRGWGH